MKKLLFTIVLGLSVFILKAQTLNPTYKLTTAGEADNFLEVIHSHIELRELHGMEH